MRTGCRAEVSSAVALAIALAPALARADVVLAPGPSGGIGAMLVAGPLLARRPSKLSRLATDFELVGGATEAAPKASDGALYDEGKPWQVVASKRGALDLRTALKTQGGEATAIASAVLRVSAPFSGYLSLGVEDGVVVYVDGKSVYARDDRRASFEDDELVPIELSPGDHPLLVKLHVHGAGWTMHLRAVDRALAAARGLSVVLPGADPAKLAPELLDVSLDRGLSATGLDPKLVVRVRGGFPRDVPRDVVASAANGGGAKLFDVRAGKLPIEEGGPVGDLEALLPEISLDELGDAEKSGELAFDAKVGDVAASFHAFPRRKLSEALAHAEKARASIASGADFLVDPESTVATIDMLVDRLRHYADRGDADVAAQLDDATELETVLAAIDKKEDPLKEIHGARRLAYRSPFDGKPSPFAIYVPPKLEPGRKVPLVVAVHGMNGRPMTMLRWFFGRDDGGHDGEWEDRHPGAFPDIEGIVVAPMAHYNGFYRWASELDVVNVLRWAKEHLPVDEDRVTITGPSMGGTGTAWIAFRYADQFAAAAPLCGYHSYFLRGDMVGKKRPWEQHLAEERSTIDWAINGLHLPLWIVHGTRDLPVENSGVLIDKYKELGYSLTEDHPDEGHNVWQPTYEGMKGFQWLAQWKRPAHPSHLVLRTDDLRYDRYAWARILELEKSESWALVRASIGRKNAIDAKTENVASIHFDRDEKRIDASQPVTLVIDKTKLAFEPDEPIDATKKDGVWAKGKRELPPMHKRRGLAGPLKDVYDEPLVVVFGTQDPLLSRANEEVARWFASVRPGWEIDYPIVRDVDFDPKGFPNHAIVLVGGASSNLVTKRLDDRLPIHVATSPPSVTVGATTVAGEDAGAAFVYPNPDDPSHYVVVLAGAGVPGTLRAMSLPDLLPDFVVWDRDLARARGMMIIGPAKLRAGGVFDESWKLPPDVADPGRVSKN